MGKVITGFTMSLDGFIAGPNDDIRQLFKWFSSGDTPFPVPGTDMVFQISSASAAFIGELWGSIGAMVTGRHDFDVSGAWGGKPPYGWPSFIVTHTPPQAWVKEGSPFTFITDGVLSAIEQARRVAGDKHVVVGGTTIVRQCLKVGLLDEIHIDLASMLLGDGKRLFDHLDTEPIALERLHVVEGTDVTHIGFRVVK
ncbi:MAG TPA: dihydrofolate reductase family protein [Herpetosiphonaceae bacterium]